MDQSQLNALIAKINEGNASDEELTAYNAYMNRIAPGHTDWEEQEMGDREVIRQELWQKVQEGMPLAPARTIRLWPRIAAAASILVILSAGGYFLLNKQKPQATQNQVAQNDLLPGNNKAILTLSNGKQINLTDAKAGIVAKDANVIVKKKENGSISYVSIPAGAANQPPAYQTITTPRGGQWPAIELPDGSKAMLDAGSSITYPVAFNGGQRKVAITGQVYFEVKHNTTSPFIVTVRGETIEDIGTHFNVSAYEDEPALKTTLIEGSVRVSKNRNSTILKPGQQAVNIPGSDKITVKNADLPEVTAWKNGLFHFTHADVKTVMRQIARWYDVEVVYEGNIPKTDITGEVYRNMKASQVFEVLNNLKVSFRIEGRKIIVTDKF